VQTHIHDLAQVITVMLNMYM